MIKVNDPLSQMEIEEIWRSTGFDSKPEVFAQSLELLGGLKTSINNIGVDRRGVSYEIEKLDFLYDAQDKLIEVGLAVNRSGVYDSLPQMFFKQETGGDGKYVDAASFDEMVKRNRRIELEARKLFAPLESCFNELRVELAHMEITLLKNQYLGYDSSPLMDDFWEFDSSFTEEDRSILTHILPFLLNAHHELESISFCLSLLCGYDVALVYRKGKEVVFSDSESSSSLNDTVLGYDSLLGERFYDKSGINLFVTLVLGSPLDYQEFIEGKRRRKLIEFILSYILPMEVEYIIQFELKGDLSAAQDLDESVLMVLGLSEGI